MCGVEFQSVPRAPHVSSTTQNWYCLVFPNFPPWTPPKRSWIDLPHLIHRRMPSTQILVSALTASWQCQRCNRTNNSAKNKRHCFLCRAWRDGVLQRGRATTASVTLYGTIWYYFKTPPPPPPAPMPRLVLPAIVVCRLPPVIRRPSSAACFRRRICRPI